MGHCAARPGVGVRGRPRVATARYRAAEIGSGANAAHAARVRSSQTGGGHFAAHTGVPNHPQLCPIRPSMDARQTPALREPQQLGDIGTALGAAANAQVPALALRGTSPRDTSPAAPAPNAQRDVRWAAWLATAARPNANDASADANAAASADASAAAITAASEDAGTAASTAAFTSFYAQSAPLALAFIRKSGGGTWCEDILTETYLQAWKDVAQFDPARGRASTWLLTIARSRCLDKLRFEALRRGVDAPQDGTQTDAEAPTAQAIDPNPGPDALLAATQNHRRLHAALATLSAPERWVLGLAFYQDLSHSEIAHTTRLPLGSVKSHIARGQRKLRELLQDAHPAGVAVKPKVSSHD